MKKPGSDEEGVILSGKVSEVREEPLNLPKGYRWDNLDLADEEVLHELYEFLRDNYVEDDEAMFRFDYQKEFLRWALQVPK